MSDGGGKGVAATEGRRYVCVSGMHRSGTSLVCRAVNLLGVDLGDTGDLLDGPDNPSGFWESLSLTKFGEKVLQRLGGSWDDPPVLADGWEASERLDRARSVGAAILDRILGPSAVVGWKDPRVSIILPFWRTVVPVQPTLLVVRNPREVAGSLARRNRFHPERSAYLWLRYNVAGWRADSRRRVVHFDDVVADPAGAGDRLAELASLPPPDAATRARVAAAVEPALRHQEPLGDGPIMQLAVEHHELLRAARPEDVDAACAELHGRWLGAGGIDAVVRRTRRVARTVVPRPVRRRIRSEVGALTSWPARRASLRPRPLVGTEGPGYSPRRPSDSCA